MSMSSILDRKKEKKPKDVDASFGSGGLFTSSSQEQRRYVFICGWVGGGVYVSSLCSLIYVIMFFSTTLPLTNPLSLPPSLPPSP